MTVFARSSQLVCLAAALSLASACSDDSSTPADFGPPVDLEVACGPDIYPCGPYGFELQDVAANEEFLAYADPDNFCKAHKDKQVNFSTLQKLGFHSWFQPHEKCADKQKKLLWVSVSAGWCVPCQNEVKEIQSQIASGAFDERVGIINVVFETGTPGTPVTRDFVSKTWSTLGLSFPMMLDPKFHMGKYFDKAATPFNMLVDTSNMKIFHRQVGSDLKVMGQKVQEFFESK